jgi:hypothetical protein
VPETLSRRDRVRAETTVEIKQTARKILVEQGHEAVTLRAIARDMGMTAPALYRYFGSHEDLLLNVCGDIFGELADEIEAAIHATSAAGGDITLKVAAACRAFRHWALNHRPEFALLFGTPVPGLDVEKDDIAEECARRFAGTFFTLFLELWQRQPFPVPQLQEQGEEPGLRDQLTRYQEGLGTDLPVGALLTFLRCWVRLYGIVSMEVFGHLHFALDDAEPIFEITLAEMARTLNLEYPPAPA